jgi:hypothetical protein
MHRSTIEEQLGDTKRSAPVQSADTVKSPNVMADYSARDFDVNLRRMEQ